MSDIFDLIYPSCARSAYEMSREDTVGCAWSKALVLSVIIVVVMFLIAFLAYSSSSTTAIIFGSLGIAIGVGLPFFASWISGRSWDITNEKINGYMRMNNSTRQEAVNSVQKQEEIAAQRSMANAQSTIANQSRLSNGMNIYDRFKQ